MTDTDREITEPSAGPGPRLADVASAVRRSELAAGEARRLYIKMLADSLRLSMRNHYVGLALTTTGPALALAGAVPHSPLAVSQYVAITLIAAGATLLAIGSLAEIYLRGLVL